MKSKIAKIITITSRKGGVGKSTFLLNLAGSYKLLEKKVLIIDLDLYTGSIDLSLNLKSNKNIFNLISDINNNKFDEYLDYIVSYNDFIDVLPSIKDPRQANKISLKYISQIISIYKHYYDVILIDTNHLLIDLNVVIFDNSDIILNIISNNLVDLAHVKSFINIINDVNFKELKLLLNESFSLSDNYFSLYDIKEYIGKNIDYYLDRNYYVKNFNKTLVSGLIPILVKNSFSDNEINKIIKIAKNLLKDKE